VLDDLYEIAGDAAAERGAAGGPPDLLLRLHVQPGAGRTAVMGRHANALKVKVGAPPEGGRANAAVVALVAEVLGIPAARVTLERGASSRSKLVRITGLEPDELGQRLELAIASGPGGAAGGGGGNAGGVRGVGRRAT